MTYNESSHPATGVKAIATTLWGDAPPEAVNNHRFVLLITDGISTETQAGSDNFSRVAQDFHFRLAVLHLRTGVGLFLVTSLLWPLWCSCACSRCFVAGSVIQGQGGGH